MRNLHIFSLWFPSPQCTEQNIYNLTLSSHKTVEDGHSGEASFNGSHTKVRCLTPRWGVNSYSSGGVGGGVLRMHRWTLTFHLLSLWRCSSSLKCASVCFFFIRPDYRGVSSVGTAGLAVKGGVRRCGGHAGLGFQTLKDVSKESVADDFFIVVVSLDCESDDEYC